MGVFESLLAPIMGFSLGPLAGPLISAGTSLLGGAINAKNERKGIAAQNAYNDPAQIRARAEAAGFNPLSFIGPGVGNQTTAASGAYMGSAIADAGMAMADGIANRTKVKQAEQLGALEIENAKLQNKLMQLTLRPKVGGVYAQRQSTPTIAAAVGGGVDVGADPETYLGYVDHKVSSSAVGDSGGIDLKPKAVIVPHVSDGQSTAVPVGQDLDEIISGAIIAANNRSKARIEFRQRHADDMTFGDTLKVPFGWVDRAPELLPPLPRFKLSERSKHPPKPKGYQKNIYDNRSLFTQWGVY